MYPAGNVSNKMKRRLLTVVHVALGFLLGIALNIAVIWRVTLFSDPHATLFSTSVSRTVFYAFVFFGATQLIWQLPLILLLRRKHNNLALGVLLAALATALFVASAGSTESFFWPGAFVHWVTHVQPSFRVFFPL